MNNNNTILLYDDDENYIGPESEYNEFGYDIRTGLKWGESE